MLKLDRCVVNIETTPTATQFELVAPCNMKELFNSWRLVEASMGAVVGARMTTLLAHLAEMRAKRDSNGGGIKRGRIMYKASCLPLLPVLVPAESIDVIHESPDGSCQCQNYD